MPSHEQQHYWTGTEWLAGDKMQVPEAGVTRLFSVPTTVGWRVDIGDSTYPIRYWDGTETRFSVNSAGLTTSTSMTAKSIVITQGDADTVAASIQAADAGFASDLTQWAYFGGTVGSKVTKDGDFRTVTSLSLWENFTDAAPGITLFAGSTPASTYIQFGDGTGGLNTASLEYYSSLTMRVSRHLHMVGYTEYDEMTAPSAPAANTVRLYSDDNGAGKTRLMALFSSGAAQQVAIQP